MLYEVNISKELRSILEELPNALTRAIQYQIDLATYYWMNPNVNMILTKNVER